MTIDQPPPRKTYSRLTTGRRIPTEYEIVSTDLHYNYPGAFELPGTTVTDWYMRHREGSKLRASDWGSFSDPRRTTYRGYTELQDKKEDVIDGLLRQVDDEGYDQDLPDEWVDFVNRWYGPLRFPVHGLQMLAAYVGQMAPSSRVTNCAAFQAADELRRLQRITYRIAQLADHRLSVDVHSHVRQWEQADALQPLRELIERALTAYDWGEALVVTNVLIKPYFDRLVNAELAGRLAAMNGDPILRQVHFSLNEDARWHHEWSSTLISECILDIPENADVISGWIEAWRPLATKAAAALSEIMSGAPVPLDGELIRQGVERAVSEDIGSLVGAPA